MLLKRLSGQLPPEIAQLLPRLELQNVRTTENVLFTPPETLYNLFKKEVPRHQIDLLISQCLAFTAPKADTGDVALLQEESRGESRWWGFGIGNLDSLMGDWNGVGVLEISGLKRVGKTLLALHAVLRLLVGDEEASCRWLDTEGSFDSNRARSILDAWGIEEPNNVLDRLQVTPCFNLEPDLVDALSDIQRLLENPSRGSPRIKAVVIDPIMILFKDTLNNSSAQGHAAMISTMEELAELTYSYGLLSMVTNATSSSQPRNPQSSFGVTNIKPSLGAAFTFCSDVSLLVQETGRVFGYKDITERERIRTGPGLRAVVEVLKSRVSPSLRWNVFETDGIRLANVVAAPTQDQRTLDLSAGIPHGAVRPAMGPLAETMIP
ncbi:hypothetical protein P7C73_g4316, partial [Tremellales sp. Uapishka_1]